MSTKTNNRPNIKGFTVKPANPFANVTDEEILAKAASIIESKYKDTGVAFTTSRAVKDFIKFNLAISEREIFAVMFLNAQHELIEYKELFYGTIDQSSVYPREVLKQALKLNASAVILAHNHPSGNTTPSEADKRITRRINEALDYVNARVLDHIIVGEDAFSFSENGLM
jgi:DNA repair protein RadC